MAPEDIKALRKELRCTARELATALDTTQDVVLAWERGELFPTKRLVGEMEELRKRGAAAIPRRKKGGVLTPWQALESPEVWKLMRKLCAHPELRAAAQELAEGYPDPADDDA